MVKFSAALAVATLAASASAFAPNHVSPKFGVDMAKQSTSALSMAEENNSKRKIAFKALKRVAGGLATVALATSGASPAFAAKKAVVEVVEAVDNTKQIVTAGATAVVAGVAAFSLLGGEKKQDFLEASPYYDQSTVPVNVYKNKSPFTGKTGSLCVRRATYWCPELKADDPAKKGICSNFLCDTKAGEEVNMTGPAGKVMLMPEKDPTTDYIMVATGTGIAPYRGFIRRLFVEKTPAAEVYKGEAWLFLGVANSDALLYDDEFQETKSKYPENFRLDYALSREQENAK
eukprot:scaffold160389_cov38-Attheya_sp.AAC.1